MPAVRASQREGVRARLGVVRDPATLLQLQPRCE